MPKRPVPSTETRTMAQLREHYELEKQLANKLLRASPEQRLSLYNQVYDELYRTISHHPRNTRRYDVHAQQAYVHHQITSLRRYLTPNTRFLEVGPGDCALSLAVASDVQYVYAVDVSAVAMANLHLPDNFEAVVTDGCSIPVPPASIDLAYSNQLMEHLHPDDAKAQVQNIYAALVPHGLYLIQTPNRLYGPHDISKYFDDIAMGFHLREYTYTELNRLLRSVGFKDIWALVRVRGSIVHIPALLVGWLETLIQFVPRRRRESVANMHQLASRLSTIRVLARKAA